jgi:putative ubiquitin-RnfH superfamily antitoxin RatB of RatAB toxin-antitoxin module
MGICLGTADRFIVEVIYALPDRAVVKSYRLGPPATVADALALAAADPDFAGIDVAESAVGIFGRTVPSGRMLQPGDRLELYRALPADPKDARRQRVQRARAQRSTAPGAIPPRRPR